MKKLSALFLAAGVFIAAVAQAQVKDIAQSAISSTTEIVQKAGDSRSSAAFKADCAAGLALDSCAKPVTPPGCPAGRHWVTMGSNIAHCVDDDPTCASNQVLQHDALGNPKCHTPVITYEYDYRTRDCPSGQTGTREQRRKYTYTDGVLTSTGSWTTYSSNCETPAPAPSPEPTPTCSNGASDYPTCTPPYTPPPATVCPNGASNYPTCTFPSGGGSGGNPPPAVCNASDTVVSSTACPSGYVGGPIQRHQTVSCPGSVVGGYDTGTCTAGKCSNGATNYPACNVGIPQTCPPTKRTCGFEQSGVIIMTVFTTTYSGPNCSASTTTQKFYVDDTSCPYD